MAALMWVSHSERPLKPNELCQALAVEIGSPNLNTDNVPSIGTLIACCQGLIVVDKEGSTVRLIHFTLEEYLRAHPELIGAAHSTMAETCLTYLNSWEVKSISTNPSPDLQDTPFLEYSSLHWGVHVKRDFSNCTELFALKLFGDYKNHISIQLLFSAENPYMRLSDSDGLSLFSGLHCASYFGIAHIVVTLVETEGCDINQMDSGGNTPLVWAAWRGHERVVKILLGREDINPDSPDRYGGTPLCLAAGSGHEGVVKILLGRGEVGPDKSDMLGRTPLHWAAEKGFETVVKILLRQDRVNPDKSDMFDQTPLCLAAGSGHEGVVKILLGCDNVNAGKSDTYSQTPLHLAAWGGYEGVVILLLGRNDVDPEKLDMLGQTPLLLAAERGFEGVMRVLPEAAYLDKSEISGQTPLSAEPGPLPLHQNDGFCSVLGRSLSHVTNGDQAKGSANDILAYNPPGDKIFCGSSKCSGTMFAPLPLYVYPLHRLTRSSGPHTCSNHSFTCIAPNCARLTPFRTKQALNRNYEATHLAQRVGSPVPRCESVGKNAVRRGDNLAAHIENKHGVSPAGGWRRH